MKFYRSTVPAVSPAWQTEETSFLSKVLVPALCVQLVLLSLPKAMLPSALAIVANVLPAALLGGYLVRVLRRAYREGQFRPWGHDGR